MINKKNVIKTTGILRVRKKQNGQRRLILELHASIFKCLPRLDKSRVVEIYIDPATVYQNYDSQKKIIKEIK